MLSEVDFVRAIRHGLDADGKPLVIMPAEYYNRLGDADLGAVIAYVKSQPPVDNEVPDTSMGPLGRIIVLLEDSLLPASIIDHTAPRPPAPEPGVTAEYGRYVATVCSICHGENMAGGPVPG